MNTGQTKTTNQKGTRLISSAGNQCLALAGSAGRKKKRYDGHHVAPTQRIYDLADAFFPSGMPDPIWGSKIPESAQNGPIYPNSCLCWFMCIMGRLNAHIWGDLQFFHVFNSVLRERNVFLKWFVRSDADPGGSKTAISHIFQNMFEQHVSNYLFTFIFVKINKNVFLVF